MANVIDWLKAKFFLLAVALMWGSLIIQLLPLQVFLMVISTLVGTDKWKQWNYSIWMVQDQFVNVVLSGHHVTTVSSTIGQMSKTSATAENMRITVDFLFRVFAGQDDHCRNALENEDLHRYDALQAALGLLGYVTSYTFFIFTASYFFG